MTISVTPVSGKRELNEFIHLPWSIYKMDETWVPPLKMAVKDLLNPNHPVYETVDIQLFIARDAQNRPIGRIAAIANKAHNDFWEDQVGFWGLFECINDQDVSTKLFATAEEWLKNKGFTSMRGPMNPSTNYECGLLVEGEEDPAQIMMTYNPQYYRSLIEQEGHTKSKDLLAYRIKTDFQMPEKILSQAANVEKANNISYRFVNKCQWDDEVERMLKIYNSAWEKNWGFVPMTENEFRHTAKELRQIIDEKLIMFVLVDGKEAGFIVCLPDFNQVFKQIPTGKLLPFGILKILRAKKYINRLRCITLGVLKEYRKLGLASLMYTKMQQNAIELENYEEAELSWILEDNIQMNKPIELMGGEVYKRYRIYDKELS